MGVDVNPHEPAALRRHADPSEQSFVDAFVRIEYLLQLIGCEHPDVPMNPAGRRIVPVDHNWMRAKVKQPPLDRVSGPARARVARARSERPIGEK
jgi:hypothetical protein